MKRKLYTLSHDVDLLKKIGGDARFSGEEHAFVTREEWGSQLSSKEDILRKFLTNNAIKLEALSFLIERCQRDGLRSIVTFGSGLSVLEYLLSLGLPHGSKVVATDFDSFLVDSASKHFSTLTIRTFDLFKDDPAQLQKETGRPFDCAVFFGSTYVMDDPEFVSFFIRLRDMGVRQVFDFHAGYIPFRKLPRLAMGEVKRALLKGSADRFQGKFHGYSRSGGALRKLYRRAGFQLAESIPMRSYDFVGVFKAP